MDAYDLQQIGESLQTFAVLKKQQLLIHSWIQLKIFVKRKVRIPSIRLGNQNFGFTKRPKDIYHTQPNVELIDEYNQYGQDSFHDYNPSIKYHANSRLHTDEIIPKSQDQNQKIFAQLPADERYHYTEHQKSVNGHHIPLEVQEQYLMNCENNDEFEDMVLDRLSKLEQSISQIMEQKKLQEENSGNIDYSSNSNPLFQNLQHLNFKDHSSEEESFPEIYPPHTIQDGNLRFSYNLQSSSLVKDSIKEKSYEQEADLSDWKYIPIGKGKEPAANIKNIKNILQNNHVNNEEYMFINDVDDFNQNQIAGYQGHNRKKSNYRPQQYTERIYANGGEKYTLNIGDYQDNQIDYSKKQKSASFRLNRIQMEQQQDDRVQINDYFVPSDMQTGNYFNAQDYNLNMVQDSSEQKQDAINLFQRYIPINLNEKADPSDELQRQRRDSEQLN